MRAEGTAFIARADGKGVKLEFDSARRRAEGGLNDGPCVLSNSLQCGDQCNDSTDVFRAIVSRGVGEEDTVDALQTRILPSG